MIPAGLKSKFALTASTNSASVTLPVPKVSIAIDTGSATPIAYASWTSHCSANSAATIFFATYLAA